MSNKKDCGFDPWKGSKEAEKAKKESTQIIKGVEVCIDDIIESAESLTCKSCGRFFNCANDCKNHK